MNASFNIDPSVTTTISLQDLSDENTSIKIPEDFRAVVIGGGTGSPASIKTLRSLGVHVDTVVAMADDGGSTGILRKDADVTPPGDVRKCLLALAADAADPLTQAFKYRFAVANNHALGNLILSALEDTTGSFMDAISVCEHLLGCVGHVFPSTLEHITLSAETMDGQLLEGQAVATKANTALRKVSIANSEGALPQASEGAVSAIKNADLIVLGPGSLFTSIIPNILVNGIVDAIKASHAQVVFVCGIADVQGETWGLSAAEHVQALANHGLDSLIDYAIFNSEDEGYGNTLNVTPDDVPEIQALGPVAVLRNLRDENHPSWHNLSPLKGAFESVISMILNNQRQA